MEQICAGYGGYDVLRGVSLRVFRGEIVSVIGPNGAGKSTIFKTIFGFLRPRTGHIRFQGAEIGGLPPDRMAERGLAYVPQGRSVFPHMTVWENLELGGYIRGDRTALQADLEAVAARFPLLREKRTALAGALSGGQQQVVEMARCLLLRPSLMLVDEPSLGLSPKFAEMIFETIRQVRDAGTTIMLVEQNARRALEISDRGYVLELGQNRYEGTGAELLASADVKRLYLGG
ncbi:MAG: ABC transporter ATP-binding protein [candidate division NC10 bacterium RIFCSPLOWO2_12_FULL_66_18]|nr:MAG: ABC transporter ATP-binding protein [candidate division NC10 bacterium RIFCSPLOWO2_02_FULL_66_22]OGB97753.1 MAG: ABC transporter ATP-binding protein [candidate division NC10 bacterium RIFCSPLOWO2_12_FULL_66_18]